jgi:putative membrane protein
VTIPIPMVGTGFVVGAPVVAGQLPSALGGGAIVAAGLGHQVWGDLIVAVMAVAYGVGLDRLWRTAPGARLIRPWQATCFAAGLATIVVATNGPIDHLADTSLAGHMTQHVLLLAVAAPLLALGEMVPAVAWTLPASTRRRTLRRWRPVRRSLTGPHWPQWLAAAIAVQIVVMIGWHLVGPYDAALSDQGIHLVEHASFLVTATFFWWLAVGARNRRASAASVLAVFVDSLGAIALGAAFILSASPLYPHYVATEGANALADQQLAGVIMWAYGGLASVVVGVGAFAAWLLAVERAELAPRISGSRSTTGAVRVGPVPSSRPGSGSSTDGPSGGGRAAARS